MSKQTAGLSFAHGSDAQFRAWGSAISAALLAAGLTNTTDTGQINWSTVVRAGSNADAGYEIWRLNDAAQSTRPMFLKIRYGTSSSTDRPRCLFDVGEGSDGSGSLTGAIKTDLTIFNSSNTGQGTGDININWNATLGFFGIACTNLVSSNCTPTTNSFERLKDATGAATTRGFAVVYSPTPGTVNYSLFASSWSTEPNNTIPAFWPVQAGGASSAGGTFISGLTPLTGDGTHGVLERTLCFCVCGSSDFQSGEQFAINRWDGNPHTYLATGTYGAANPTTNMNSHARHAMLWE